MSKNIYIVDSERCTGCRLCEIICSVKHTGVSNPARSSIHIIKWDNEGFYLPMLCQHCQDAACMAICPKGAISRDDDIGRIMINYDLCMGCKMCISACPFGAMGFDAKEEKVFKCDLCDGNPQCVRFCDMKAIDYVNVAKVQTSKMREAAEHYSELMRKHQ
mmetsp:Transcript_6262/g.3509  ORF Transcript_6262/g.3509 Transcript_6262/m.3509 type:complete len:161 (-) Transcript_6262:675-1157(-)